MKSLMNGETLILLTYLHEHVEGYGPECPINSRKVMEALGFDVERFCRSASFLDKYGLGGMLTADAGDLSEGPEGAFCLINVYLTGFGAIYLEALESNAAMGRVLTVKSVTELLREGEEVIVSVASQVLGEMMKGKYL